MDQREHLSSSSPLMFLSQSRLFNLTRTTEMLAVHARARPCACPFERTPHTALHYYKIHIHFIIHRIHPYTYQDTYAIRYSFICIWLSSPLIAHTRPYALVSAVGVYFAFESYLRP